MSLATIWTQAFPPRNGSPLTEANLPDQTGKVFIVTGGSSGIGYELSRILYGAGGKVYMATRSKEHAEDAISRIQAHYAADGFKDKKTGSLEFIYMNLVDFTTVKAAARQFLDREGPNGRLDTLFNNAGVGATESTPPTPQNHEHFFATNSLGAHLLTRLLTPILSQTAKRSPKDAVRVVWAASILVEISSPKGGVRKEFLQGQFNYKNHVELYASTKVANWFLASEFSRRQVEDGDGVFGSGVVHLAGNPGNYSTGICRAVPPWLMFVIGPLIRRPAVHGAETFMWMAFSDEVTMRDAAAGRYAMCDGRWHPGQRSDLVLALKGEEEGGTGRAKEFFQWCEERVKEFIE